MRVSGEDVSWLVSMALKFVFDVYKLANVDDQCFVRIRFESAEARRFLATFMLLYKSQALKEVASWDM